MITNQITPTRIEPDTQSVYVERPETPTVNAKFDKTKLCYREYFVNDLSLEEKDELIKRFTDEMKSYLDSAKLTINSVARLFNIDHAKTKRIMANDNSLKSFLVKSSVSKDLGRMYAQFARLTHEQKQKLVSQLTGQT